MKRPVTVGVLLLLVTVPAVAATGEAAPSSAVPVNTQPSQYLLEDNTNQDLSILGRTLLAPTDRFDYSSYLYGIYSGPDEDTSDFHLYVFPNGKFALEYDCHCKTPAFFMSLGSWQRNGNTIELRVERKAPRPQCAAAAQEFDVAYGPLAKMDFFVTASGPKVIESVLAPEPTLMKAPMDRLFIRKQPIKNWNAQLAKIQAELGSYLNTGNAGRNGP